MAVRPAFEKPKSTEDLVQLYDYIYQESNEPLQHKSGRILGPYGSHPTRNRTHFAMLEEIRKKERGKKPSGFCVLDASCGRGHLLQELCTRGWKCHGTEVSDYLMENDLKHLPVAKANYDNIVSVCGAQSFDVVISNDVLEHLVNRKMVDRAMENLSTVSKKWLQISVGILGTAATKYPSALGLEVQRLHTFCKTREWWFDYMSKYMKVVHSPRRENGSPLIRAGMGFYYGEKK